MSMKSIAKSGAIGNTTLLKKYGGHGETRQTYAKGYATGGAVKGYATGGAPSGSMDTDGAPAKPSLARPGRKMGKGKAMAKKGGTNVNIIIAGKGDGGDKPPMMPPGPPMDAGPMPPPPGAGPGGPPMPMRAKGGRVTDAKEDKSMVAKMIHKHEKEDHKGSPMTKFQAGGKVRMIKDGAGGGKGRLEKIKAYGSK